MEILIYFVLITILWLSSLTFLLPFFALLCINKSVRDKWFSFIFFKFMGPRLGPLVRPNRRRAFKLLIEDLPERNASKLLNVLEIGIGVGANLSFYPENTKLTALDMNKSFEKYFNETKKKFPNITYEGTIINNAENMVDVASNTYDVVVCTFVLCSVGSIESVLKEVLRVLKPGGKFLFVEHVIYTKSVTESIAQKYANPLWKIYCDGCCLDRNIGNYISNAGFESVHCEEQMMHNMPLLLRPQILGIATKYK